MADPVMRHAEGRSSTPLSGSVLAAITPGLLAAGGLALAGYAAYLATQSRAVETMAVWFAGSVVGHDLVLFPLYAGADRVLVAVLHRPAVAARLRLSPVNHIRVPTLGAVLLFCLYFPGIVRQGGPTYADATGQTQQPFLGRWLVAVAVLYLASALVYVARLRRAGRRLDAQAAPTSEGSDAGVARPGG